MKKIKESLVVNNGFITIYAILILMMIMSFSSMITQKIKTNILEDDTLSRTEIYTIHKVKIDLKNYDEKDETFMYDGYQVDLKYDDVTCYIQIYKNNELKVNSILVYDDIDDFIVSYTYQ